MDPMILYQTLKTRVEDLEYKLAKLEVTKRVPKTSLQLKRLPHGSEGKWIREAEKKDYDFDFLHNDIIND